MPPNALNPWEITQQLLKELLDEHTYKNWFGDTHFKSFTKGLLTVTVPSSFIQNWLLTYHLNTITDLIRANIPDAQHIAFEPLENPPPDPFPENNTAPPARASKHKRSAASLPLNGFDPRYTFDRFITGPNNVFAHAAAKAVATAPTLAYNPLFIFGATGLGKTHLVQAIGHEIAQQNPAANIIFTSSESFTNQLIQSITKRTTHHFRTLYRKTDVLLIDDIDFIAGKEATQEEFFHTFNELIKADKLIVVSNACSPQDIQKMQHRLSSRFSSGLTVDIQAPDLDTRRAILHAKTLDEKVPIPPEVINYIATHITTSIRELEGALITVLAYAKLLNHNITPGLAEEVLCTFTKIKTAKPVTVHAIQQTIADHFNVRISDLCGTSRQRQICFPRQLAIHLCKTLIPTLSLNLIGEAFGGKDHTTIMHTCRKMAREAETVPATQQLLDRFENTLRHT